MKRYEALKNLIKCVFGSITLSVDSNGELQKNMSMFQNCNYNVKSYNSFKKLFEIAFIKDNPKDADLNDFNRNEALERAKDYLALRGIDISEKLPLSAQCEIVFDILVNYFLYAIIIDNEGCSSAIAKNKDVTHELSIACSKAQSYYNQRHLSYDVYDYLDKDTSEHLIIDSNYKDSPSECNYAANVPCEDMESYKILVLLRNINLVLLKKCDNGTSVMNKMKLKEKLLSGYFTNEIVDHKEFPIFSFTDNRKLFKYVPWQTYINPEDVVSNNAHQSIGRKIDEYYDMIVSKAYAQVEQELNELLKPFYENNRTKLERLISALTSLTIDRKSIDLNALIKYNSSDIQVLLLKKCNQIFWDFELPYSIIEKTYQDNINKGLYISIQNTIIELTDLLNSYGTRIAYEFKRSLSSDSLKKHKGFIKKLVTYSKSDKKTDLDRLIDFEKKLSVENAALFSEPRSISDFFFCIRKNVFSNFKSALYNYNEQLKNVDS